MNYNENAALAKGNGNDLTPLDTPANLSEDSSYISSTSSSEDGGNEVRLEKEPLLDTLKIRRPEDVSILGFNASERAHFVKVRILWIS